MPLPFLNHVLSNGLPGWIVDHAWALTYSAIAITLLVFLKRFTSGRSNPADAKLHGKVIILTGGTSGVGAQVARGLAEKGAQLVLLTQVPANDPFLVEYIQDLRDMTDNQMIYAEQVDLADLLSIRAFATKWIDNAPPRRLDMVVLCAATLTPPGGKRRETEGGVEETWMVNFLANFHLLSILSPALRAQPFDRNVRVIMAMCPAYIGSPSLKEPLGTDNWSPGTAYARSKLALLVFGGAFQKHLDAYKRPDSLPMNSRVVFVDPGLCRTPGMRRWLTRGSLFGLAVYLVTYAATWLVLKSPNRGAQSFLYAAMEPSLGRGEGGKLVKECMEVDFARPEAKDEAVAKKLWEESDALIERTEKEQAKKRAARKAAAEKEKKAEEDQAKKEEVQGLVDAIKKGKEAQKLKSESQGKRKSKKASA